jgi:predicted methyltransferase
MIRITLRQVAATTVLTASAWLAPSLAGEATPEAPAKPYVIPAKAPEAIKKAIQSPDRPAADVARDSLRRPADVLWLANVKPGSKVIEFSPYGWYYSRLLAEVVGPKGMVNMYDMPFVEEVFGKQGRDFAAAHPNVKYEVVDFNKVEFPRNVDVVFDVLNFHEMLLRGVDTTPFYAKVFKAMKPGAIYLLVDHKATHGTGTDQTGKLHRVDILTVKQNMNAYGFELVEESRILENGQDDHSWPVGTAGKRDTTDQMVLKFRKPVVY